MALKRALPLRIADIPHHGIIFKYGDIVPFHAADARFGIAHEGVRIKSARGNFERTADKHHQRLACNGAAPVLKQRYAVPAERPHQRAHIRLLIAHDDGDLPAPVPLLTQQALNLPRSVITLTGAVVRLIERDMLRGAVKDETRRFKEIFLQR